MGSLAGGLETGGDLEGVVDPPLETGKGTNHEDTGTEAGPEAVEADAGVDLASSATLLVHDGDHSVGGVRDDSAENTSPVTRHEGDHQLEALRVGVTGSSEDVAVEETDGLLEGDELDDSVGDLTAPEGNDTLVEQGPATLVHHLRPALASGKGEGAGVGGLDFDLELLCRNKRVKL